MYVKKKGSWKVSPRNRYTLNQVLLKRSGHSAGRNSSAATLRSSGDSYSCGKK